MANTEYLTELHDTVKKNRATGADKKLYQKHLKTTGYNKLVRVDPSLKLETEIPMLVAEGQRSIDAEAKKPSAKKKGKDDSKNLCDTLGENSKNPYIRARYQIFKQMRPEERAKIEKMEKDNNMDHPSYKKFVHVVCLLGDKLGDEQNQTKKK